MVSSSSLVALLVSIFLVLQPSSSSDILAPLFQPFVDQLCKSIACGKGKCKASENVTFGYMCECDQGWKQVVDNNHNLGFLPCVIPNCTLNYACTKAPTPSPQDKAPPNNNSFFDPCNWAYCGQGSCIKSGQFGHQCKCHEGYSNLLNTTVFPCLSECTIGMNCAHLGLTTSNKSVAPPPSSTGRNTNYASSIKPGKILWMLFLTLTIASSPWK